MMKSTRQRVVGRKPPPPPTPTKGKRNKQKDPVEVYCRIRPLHDPQDSACVKPVGNTIIQLSSPDPTNILRNGVIKETQYTFKFVFDDKTTQKALFDHAALPLVEDLLSGKNGLLFTYGVTGSGKTFTMTGTPQDGGLLPRSLDVIFNSLGELQANKYVFKPDRLNGFDVQSQADAMIDRQKDYVTSLRAPKTPKRKDVSDTEERVSDPTKVDCVDEDSNYSVFVQYIEIYNNYVYDLLEDVPIDPVKPRQPQAKIMREDASHNMYIHCATEIEVKSTEDAFEAFYKGQKRRRVAHTTLNTESSRSHSVFTIRLVQAPLDFQGEEVLQEKSTVCISQLSLVDLAGSERTMRTKNCGDRLREAGNINNSLMALRACIEALRENQTTGANKIVPYRESKVTHLFKNYFDGEGKVRMVVCINSSSDDYEENLHIMRFAEMVQEVQISRPILSKIDLGLTPGRRRANLAFKEDMEKRFESPPIAQILSAGSDQRISAAALLLSNLNFGPTFPQLELLMASDDITLVTLIDYLRDRELRRSAKLQEFKENQLHCRSRIIDVEKENVLMKQQIETLKLQLESREQKIRVAESKLSSAEHEKNSLSLKLNTYERKRRHMENELDEKTQRLNQEALEKERLRTKMQDKILSERERVTRQMTKKMREDAAKHKTRQWQTDEKFKQLRTLCGDEWQPASGGPQDKASKSDSKLNVDEKVTASRRQRSVSPAPHTSRAVANPRHRRSRSQGGGVCVDHVPPGTVELGTLLQPKMRKRRSVTKLTVKDVTKDAAHYVLTHQLQDQRGDVETRYYKGAVIPTAGGGAQVVLNDVETLKQMSPGSRKRNVLGQRLSGDSSGSDWTDVQTRCATGIEGHNNNQKRNRV